MGLRFIFMLTRNDRTVADAWQQLQTARSLGVRHIGFKDIGLPMDQLHALNTAIKAGGATSYMEVVSLDRDSEMASAKAAAEIGVDVLLGGTRVDDVLPIIKGTGIQYFPFPGRISGHPSVLEGSIGEIVESAKAIAARDGVHGLDLLAYRSKGDVPALMKAVCSSVSKPVYVAGSIDTPERIALVRESGARGFTIGTAALDGRYPATGKDVCAQLSAIIRDLAALNADASSRKTSHWIDTHCHLDATELGADAHGVRARARAAGVVHCVIPAVAVSNFDAVRSLAHTGQDSYCLGIHPLYVAHAALDHLGVLDAQLAAHQGDPRLVAVGEIGLDYFVPELCQPPLREKQEHFYREQLKLARKYDLPVVLHVRRSADPLLKHLRDVRRMGSNVPGWSGIAHAFNGSDVQAQEFIRLGFKLGFGGAVTYERALQLRRLASTLPLDAIVLETDAPDIPPHWLYATAQARADGAAQGRNEPAELPRIGSVIAGLRGITQAELALASSRNARAALPRLAALLEGGAGR